MVLSEQVQSQLLEQWNSVAESLVKASYLARVRYAHQVTAAALHILQDSAFLSYVEFKPDYAVSSEK